MASKTCWHGPPRAPFRIPLRRIPNVNCHYFRPPFPDHHFTSKVSPDRENLSKIFSNPANVRYEPQHSTDASPEYYGAKIDEWLAEIPVGEKCYLLLCSTAQSGDDPDFGLLEHETVIGFASFKTLYDGLVFGEDDDIPTSPRAVNIKLIINQPYLRQGYGKGAAMTLIPAAFTFWLAEEVYFETMAENKPFRGLMRSLGWGRLGVLELQQTHGRFEECVYVLRKEDCADQNGKFVEPIKDWDPNNMLEMILPGGGLSLLFPRSGNAISKALKARKSLLQLG